MYSDHETDDKNEGDERVYINAKAIPTTFARFGGGELGVLRCQSSGIELSSEGVTHSQITEAVNNAPPRTSVSILPLDVFSPT